MRQFAFALSATLMFGAIASAQQDSSISCTGAGGCRVDKYGLGAHDSYGKEPDPVFENTHPTVSPMARDFGGSYAFQKDVGGVTSPKCDGEGGFVGQFGQVLLREQNFCTPTDTVGCPVEMATDLNPLPTEVGSASETWFADSRLIFANIGLAPGVNVLLFISTASHGRLHG